MLNPSAYDTIAGGDMNGTHADDDRQFIGAGASRGADLVGAAWERMLPHLVEAHQPDPTRRQVTGGRLQSMARLDRFYMRVGASYLIDTRPRAIVVGSVVAERASDHIPVVLNIPQRGGVPSEGIPVWACRDAAFTRVD